MNRHQPVPMMRRHRSVRSKAGVLLASVLPRLAADTVFQALQERSPSTPRQ